MKLFSFLQKHSVPNMGPVNIAVDAPEEVHPSQGVVPVSVVITSGSEEVRVSNVYVQLIEKYNRHTEDFQQTPDDFHEVKSEAEDRKTFTVAPYESETIHFQLDISNLRQKTNNIVQENITSQQPVTKILRTGPEVSNVLRLGDNKENVRYNLKTIVTVNGKQLSPPLTTIILRTS